MQINDSSKIKIIENFPADNGWYLQESQFGIPIGSKASSNNDEARYLLRTNEYVGLLARVYVYNYYGRHDVDAYGRPSVRIGVLAKKAGPDMLDLLKLAEDEIGKLGPKTQMLFDKIRKEHA